MDSFNINTLPAQLVSCGTQANPCDFCDVVITIDNIVGFIIGISVTLFLLVIVYAGFSLITSGGDTSQLDRAKRLLTNGVVGIIIIIASWFIIDTVLKLTTGDKLGVWNDFTNNCGEERRAGKLNEDPIVATAETFDTAFSDLPARLVPYTYETNTEFDSGSIGTGGAGGSGGFDKDGNISAGGLYGPSGSAGGKVSEPVAPPQKAGEICYELVCLQGYQIDTSVYPYNYPENFGPGLFLDITEVGNPQISRHFRLCDLTRCESSGRIGNYVYLHPRAVEGINLVQDKLTQTKLKVTSGYRSPAYNLGVGGATVSQHMYGRAFDIVATGGLTIRAIEIACQNNGAGWTKQYTSSNFTHCDWR